MRGHLELALEAGSVQRLIVRLRDDRAEPITPVRLVAAGRFCGMGRRGEGGGAFLRAFEIEADVRGGLGSVLRRPVSALTLRRAVRLLGGTSGVLRGPFLVPRRLISSLRWGRGFGRTVRFVRRTRWLRGATILILRRRLLLGRTLLALRRTSLTLRRTRLIVIGAPGIMTRDRLGLARAPVPGVGLILRRHFSPAWRVGPMGRLRGCVGLAVRRTRTRRG